jgi:RNA polymerase sigma-70 factor (ECF subfamily)
MTDAADRLYERLLVLRCQAGDEAAFVELVERFEPQMRYYLRKMLWDAHIVDDILQDVWVDVFRAVSRLADVDAFRAWLYRIAHDRAARELRKRRPAHRPLLEVELIDDSADDLSFSAVDVERLHAALDELPPEHREVLVLRFLEDMPYEEIARVIGCPLGTARSRIHYARRALRRALERKDKGHD